MNKCLMGVVGMMLIMSGISDMQLNRAQDDLSAKTAEVHDLQAQALNAARKAQTEAEEAKKKACP
jgi:hypothetical protein